MNITYKANSSLNDFEKEVRDMKIIVSMLGIADALISLDKQERIKTSLTFKLFDIGKHRAPFWYFDEKAKKHVIALPDYFQLPDYAEKREYYLAESLHSVLHELGHALFTDKDIESVSKKLKDEDVPFDIVNIFEDIRQECLVSDTFLKGLPLINYCENEYRVPGILGREKITENDEVFQVLIKLLKHQGKHTSSAYANPYFVPVYEYVQRAINAFDTQEVADISIEFYKKYQNFLEPYLPPPSQQKNGEADLSSIKDMELSDGEKEALLEDSKEIDLNDINCSLTIDVPVPENKEPPKIKDKIKNNNSNTSNLINITNKTPKNVNYSQLKKIQKVQDELKNIITHKEKVKQDNYDFNGEINIDNMISILSKTDINVSPTYVEKEKQKDKKTLHIYYDLSGSMGGDSHENGVALLFAINSLCVENQFEASVTFCKGTGYGVNYQTVALPIHPNSFFTLKATGGFEGLDEGVKNSMNLYKKSDYTLIMSDGCVRDHEIEFFKEFFKNNPKLYNKTFLLYLDDAYYMSDSDLAKLFSNSQIIANNDLELAVKELVEKINNPQYNDFAKLAAPKPKR